MCSPQKRQCKATKLGCRNEVVAWLASIGAERTVPTKKQTGLPILSEEQWQQLQPKTGRAAIVAKEPAGLHLKEAAAKAKEPSLKAKEAVIAKPRDPTAVPKPKGRPRYMANPDQLSHVTTQSDVTEPCNFTCCL